MDRTEHIIRMLTIAVVLLGAGIGAALTEGEVQAAMLGVLACMVPAAADSLRVSRRMKGGDR